MKKILPFALLFSLLILSCGDTSTPSSPSDTPSSDSAKISAEYICPCGNCGYEGGPDPGACPKCGMELEKSTE